VRAHLAANPGESTDLVFTSNGGGPLDPDNFRKRVLKPLVEEVGAPWAGFHTFRHTFASIHLSEGTNLVALSRALGHHSPAFTLSRYTHLLPGESAPPVNILVADATSLPVLASASLGRDQGVPRTVVSASVNTLRRCDGTPGR
jgi:integrase